MKVFTTHNIEVKVYKSRNAMRKAIRRIGYSCDHTEAMLVPVTAFTFKNGEETKLSLIGEMYLHENAALPVVVHETLHAATTVLRSNKEALNLSTKITYKEELLAYTQTAILQDVLKEFFPKKNSQYKFDNIKRWARDSVKKPK
jgi:hypothetical protein